MSVATRPPCILRLSYVTMKDFVPVEDMQDSKLAEIAASRGPAVECGLFAGGSAAARNTERFDAVIPFDKPPAVFTGPDEWPTSTNLLCWDSGFAIPGRPAFIPKGIARLEDGTLEIGVRGLTMTFNNAALWAEAHLRGQELQQTRELIGVAYGMMFGVPPPASVAPAPPRTRMRQYGGDWEAEDYLREVRALDPVRGLRSPAPILPERLRPAAAATDAAPAKITILSVAQKKA